MSCEPDVYLFRLVFRFVFIPWLQAELDAWVQMYNSRAKRKNRNSILPRGIPDLIFANPAAYHSVDLKVCRPALFCYLPSMPQTDARSPNLQIPHDSEHLQEVRLKYAPPSHSVHNLVPPAVGVRLQALYEQLGSPEVNHQSAWPTYVQLLEAFEANSSDADIATAIQEVANAPDVGHDPDDLIDLLPGKEPAMAGIAQRRKIVADSEEDWEHPRGGLSGSDDETDDSNKNSDYDDNDDSDGESATMCSVEFSV